MARGRMPELVRLDPALDSPLSPDARLDTNVTIPGLNGEGPMWRDGSLANQRIFFDFSKSRVPAGCWWR